VASQTTKRSLVGSTVAVRGKAQPDLQYPGRDRPGRDPARAGHNCRWRYVSGPPASPSGGRELASALLSFGMYVAGATFYGRVMVVPGLLRVETRFLHAGMVPLVPTSSWVMLDSPEEHKLFDPSFRGHRLPSLSWRSIGFAYLRFLLAVGMIFGAIFVYVMYAVNGLHPYVLIPVFVAVGSLLAYRKTQKSSLASLDDLARLGELGVPREILDRARAQLDINSPARVLAQ
jgi:hypothetical protein